jgi:hypothetical protein
MEPIFAACRASAVAVKGRIALLASLDTLRKNSKGIPLTVLTEHHVQEQTEQTGRSGRTVEL